MNKLLLLTLCWLMLGTVLRSEPTQMAAPVVSEVNKPVTFTTKDGKTYVNASVSVTDTGLSVLISDGGASVDFDQIPDDISSFPDSVRKVIAERRKAIATNTNSVPPIQAQAGANSGDKIPNNVSSPVSTEIDQLVSFTTKDGKNVKSVKVILTHTVDTVLYADGSEGKVEVPYGLLPDDLSVFPVEVRNNINYNITKVRESLNMLLAKITAGGTDFPSATNIELAANNRVTITYNKDSNHARSGNLKFDNAIVCQDDVDLVLDSIDAQSDDGTKTKSFGVISLKGKAPDAIQLQIVGGMLHSVPQIPLLIFPIDANDDGRSQTTATLLRCLSTIFPFDPDAQLNTAKEKLNTSSTTGYQ